jgi:hypothetical protein
LRVYQHLTQSLLQNFQARHLLLVEQQKYEEDYMQRLLGYLLAMTIGFGSGAAISKGPVSNATGNNEAQASAAFRDGLYLGSHDAKSRSVRHVAVGRWSIPEDRSKYAAGYEAGFSANE